MLAHFRFFCDDICRSENEVSDTDDVLHPNSILIPIQCEFYALEGVSQLIQTFTLIKEGLNPNLEIEGVLLTMADFRTNLTSEVIKEIKNYFKEKVYETVIPRNIKLSEAPSYGKPIAIYDVSSIGAKRYLELAGELLHENVRKSNEQKDLQTFPKRIDVEALEKSSEEPGENPK